MKYKSYRTNSGTFTDADEPLALQVGLSTFETSKKIV